MKIATIGFEKLSREKTLRSDFEFQNDQSHLDSNFYLFKELFDLPVSQEVKEQDLYEDFLYCEIGNVDNNGNISPVKLNFDNRNLIDENYYSKIEKGDIMSVDIGEILISKVRPNLKKYVFINEANHSVYFTKAFIKIKPKIMPAVLYYCLRTVFNRKLVAASRQGKGYPTVGQMDLEQLRFEKHIIDKLITHEKEITEKIKLIDEKTKELQDGIVSAEEIIDSVFQNEFNIDKDALIRIDNAQLSFISLASISEKNINCRLSYRWNKANQIQNELSKQLNCCQPLGPHILNTQNGWSPSCSDDSNMDYQVLGIDAINKSGILSFENPKYSSEYKNDLEKYTISNGDFFVSRGNTTSLVALASIAYTNAETPPTIFPDLMIKITFGTAVNQTYMAYVFNSFIGRLYFKYATKGKNQTMVKVSSRELSDFIVPIPDILTQEQIACHIQREIEKQNDLQEQILNLRNQIHQIIIATIQKC